MALSSNLYKFKVQTLENIFAQTAAPKVPEWPSYGNFREVIENPHFLKKCKGGTNGNFFKNRSKSKPRLKGRNYYALKGKDWRRFSRKAALKVPEWPSYGYSRKVTQNPHFLKKCKFEIFQKSPKK